MITIAIDEYGDFNFLGLKNDDRQNIQFIAGIVYNDMDDPQDANFERQRLDGFFRIIAEDKGVSYPEAFYSKTKGMVSDKGLFIPKTEVDELNTLDLKFEGGGDSEEHPYAAKKTVLVKEKAIYKSAISVALPEFFKNGTYRGKSIGNIPPRKGFYSIAVMLKSKQGKRRFTDEQTGLLMNDGVGSNLYWHMADAIVSRLVFHNPYNLDVDRIEFNLPTRITEVSEQNLIKIEEFRALGYKEYQFPRGRKPDPHKVYFQVTNDFNYRAALDRRSIDYNRLHMDVKQFKALSINYDIQDYKETEKYAFLYLANFLCGHFSYYGKLHTLVSDGSRFDAIKALTNELNGTVPNLLFVYDDIDSVFEKAMTKYQRQNYVAALETLYDGRHEASQFTDYYQTEWFPHIEELIHGESDVRGIERAIQDLAYYSERVNCNADKLAYMFEHLEELVHNLECLDLLASDIAYAFYDTGMTAFNHVGNSSMALHCFNKCQELSRYVPIENYLLTLKRRVVSLIDCYGYKDALELALSIVDIEERIQSLRIELLGPSVGSISLGQAYSQLGQVYAYLNQSEAEQAFKKALEIFDSHSSDAYRTMSYLLHYYIESGNRSAYKEFASKYFGGRNTLNEQLYYIVSLTKEDKGLQSMAFALFVFVKALFVLYKDDIDADMVKRLEQAEKKIREATLVNSHPWELIYTYLSLIALQAKCNPIAIVWRQQIMDSVDNTGLPIEHSMIYGLIRFYETVNDIDKAAYYRELLTSAGVDIHHDMTYMNR